MNSNADALTIADAVTHHAKARPAAVAFVCGEESLTFAELERRSNAVAYGLRAVGIRPGSHVAYLGKNSLFFMEVAAGVVRMGGIFTPINWRLAAAEVAFMLKDCSASIIFVDPEYMSMVDVLASDVPNLQYRVSLRGLTATSWLDYQTWRNQQLDTPTRHASLPGDMSILIYTSGTTGRPKGVLLTHRNLRSLPGLECEREWPTWNQWRSDDVSLVTSPMFHVGGIGWVIRGLYPGSTQILLREFTPHGVLESVTRCSVTRLALVPSAMRLVLQEPDVCNVDFSSLKYIYYGTSPIPLDLLREGMRVFKCKFVQSYGQTETSSSIVALAPEHHTLEDVPHMRSAGKPLPGVELTIWDVDGKSVPTGSVGEIVTRSSSNMAGYLNLPRETAETLDAQGWLRTGDAGYLDQDGFVYVQDRIKEMIITGGENVYPAEVENALYGHPAVSEVAVIGVPSQKWGQAIKAVVALRPDKTVTEAALIAWARQRIGGYKLPKSVTFVDALPHNATGKVIKNELRRLYSQDDAAM